MEIDLPLLWAVIIGFGLMMYVIMDGFDLGIGILFPFVRSKEDRDTMVNSVAPVWDGNETWLVLGGASLLAAFPIAYAIILSALYLPLMLMLIGLIWRGVAFEFRFKATESHKPFWDKAFIWGSYTATFSQGLALGAYIDGFKVYNGAFVGGLMDWLSPFSLFTGFALVLAYSLLGATWLVLKTEGALQQRMRGLGQRAAMAVLAALVIVSIWTPLAHAGIAARWFTLPNLFYLAPVPLLAALVTWRLVKSLSKDSHIEPFLLSLTILFLGYAGLVISLWPQIVPSSMSVWQAAAPASSMSFALVGALIIIPFILGYTAWSYYVFRGKVKVGGGYH